MKTVFFFANQFPYGKYETYIETEIKYWNQYKKVFIFSLSLRKENKEIIRHVPENVEVISVPFHPFFYILYGFAVLFDKHLYTEIKELFTSKRLSPRSVFRLIIYISRSHYEANYIYHKMKGKIFDTNDLIFYSYRFDYQPYVALLLRKKLNLNCIAVSRAHRYDLYEDYAKSGYIPMRKTLLSNLRYCFPCSEEGSNYLRKRFPEFHSKIITEYLGTEDHGYGHISRTNVFKIVSCSNLVEVKRVDLIIKSLSLIRDYKIEWTHYGTGPLSNDLKKLAKKELGENITVIWKGLTSNETVLKEYKENNYNLFVNVSSSEGLPVSIMEAMSFGIPCIATNVNGTSEILANGNNGILLPADASNVDISKSIIKFITMDENIYQKYRKNARITWENKFNAESNYKQFSDLINSI